MSCAAVMNGVAPASVLFDHPNKVIVFLKKIGRLSVDPPGGAPSTDAAAVPPS